MSQRPAFDIVRPDAKDAATIAALGRLTFAETFVGMSYYTQDIIDGYTEVAFTPEIIAAELKDPKVHYFLVKAGDEAAGYAKLVEKPAPDCLGDLPKSIYLERIYLAKAFHRHGLGTRLLNTVLAAARHLHYEHLWLSVWEFNRPAVAFYQRHGFKKAGEWEWPYESRGVKYVDTDWLMTVGIPSQNDA